jgi:hypothetical protein
MFLTILHNKTTINANYGALFVLLRGHNLRTELGSLTTCYVILVDTIDQYLTLMVDEYY